jgi:transcriptional regulator with XRE-family HTH domain
MRFATRLKNLRQQVGVSQQDVADAIKIARTTYAGIEAGRRDPNLQEILALSEYFEIPTDSLINDTQTRSPLEEGTIASYNRPSENTEDIEPREIDPRVHPEKLREVLLYILNKVGAKPNVGETVLYKLLYFIDMDYYEKHGRSITGLTYVHNTFGPSPKLKDFRAIINDMQEHNELEIVETRFFSNKQKKYLPHKVPSLRALSATELNHIDVELARLSDKNATELSDLSHKDMPWVATPTNQPIDYQLAMYRTAATSVREDDGVEI